MEISTTVITVGGLMAFLSILKDTLLVFRNIKGPNDEKVARLDERSIATKAHIFATKDEVAALDKETSARFEGLDHKITASENRIYDQVNAVAGLVREIKGSLSVLVNRKRSDDL